MNKTSKKDQAIARIFLLYPIFLRKLLINFIFFQKKKKVWMNSNRILNNRINRINRINNRINCINNRVSRLHESALDLVYNDFKSDNTSVELKDTSI